MIVSYSTIYQQALTNYKKQQSRAGYTPGLFTSWRHSCVEYPELITLKNRIESAGDPQTAKAIIIEYLSKLQLQKKINNHSFASYFLDQLTMNDNANKWEQFYPNDKKLVFYNGTLYRGMRIDKKTLEDIFTNGIKARETSYNIDDYVSDASLSLGISTSKDMSVAKYYATGISARGFKECGKVFLVNGYVFEIDYQGMGGIDIIPTLEARKHSLRLALAKTKQEVNIIEDIPASSIKGAYAVSPKKDSSSIFYPNPNYLPSDRQNKFPDIALPNRLETLIPNKPASRFC